MKNSTLKNINIYAIMTIYDDIKEYKTEQDINKLINEVFIKDNYKDVEKRAVALFLYASEINNSTTLKTFHQILELSHAKICNEIFNYLNNDLINYVNTHNRKEFSKLIKKIETLKKCIDVVYIIDSIIYVHDTFNINDCIYLNIKRISNTNLKFYVNFYEQDFKRINSNILSVVFDVRRATDYSLEFCGLGFNRFADISYKLQHLFKYFGLNTNVDKLKFIDNKELKLKLEKSKY